MNSNDFRECRYECARSPRRIATPIEACGACSESPVTLRRICDLRGNGPIAIDPVAQPLNYMAASRDHRTGA